MPNAASAVPNAFPTFPTVSPTASQFTLELFNSSEVLLICFSVFAISAFVLLRFVCIF
ncbi:hypothetical protein EVA_10097 [gut metagenome]|uniref:Uncharacterized protein n=1 Tax=gut metagenome TaxID=749906 RepID=J9CNU9_9ZZZZ